MFALCPVEPQYRDSLFAPFDPEGRRDSQRTYLTEFWS